MKKYTLLFTACLLGFTIYISLDTFVLSSSYQKNATGMALSLFDTESSAEPTVAAEEPSEDLAGSGEHLSNRESEADGDSTAKSHTDRKRKPDGNAPEKRHEKPGHSGKGQGSDTTAGSSGNTGTSEPVTLENAVEGKSYQDENISITLTEYTTNNTTVYVADVKVSSAQYLKTAFANDIFGKNVTDEVSDIAEDHGAVLAINGDYYGAREKGIVIRNGIVYRDTEDDADLLCIFADGSMKILDQSTASVQELLDEGVWQVFSFGPALVVDGEVAVSENEEVGLAKASNPRTAIGMIDELHYIFVVSDGRTDESEGLSLFELAEFMKQAGAVCAYNLDGGGSSTMVFNGEVINNPTSGGTIKERKVSDIVYIGS